MKSRRIIEKTLLTPVIIGNKKQLLINRYIETNQLLKKYKDEPEELKRFEFHEGAPRESLGIDRDSILFQVYRSIKKGALTVEKPDKKLSIINVKFSSNDELFAKLFVEELVKNTSTFYVETKTSKFKNNVRIIEGRLDSVKTELNEELYGAALFKDKNSNVIRAQGSVPAAKRQLNVQVLTAMYVELTKNLEIAKYSLMREEPLVQIIDNPTLPLEKNKLGKMMATFVGGLIAGIISLLYLTILRIRENLKNQTIERI